MENSAPNEKKTVGKAKSHISGPSIKVSTEPAKRKSFNVNEAVRSLDVALGRLKKIKLVDGEYTSNTAHTSPVRHRMASAHMLIDRLTESNYNYGVDTASLMSMNFSHYELMRNLSNCNSDGAFSSTTCNALSASDITSKNEHLERYFRSIDTWGRNSNAEPMCARPSTSDAQLSVPDK